MKKNGVIYTILAIVLIVGCLVYSIILFAIPEHSILQGEVEARQIRVSSKLVGRIDSICIHKGDFVSKGQLLFTINSPELEAKYMQAQAGFSGAMAQNNKAIQGAQQEDIDAAYNMYLKAKAAAVLAQKTFLRISNLFYDGVVPKQKFDEAEMQNKVAIETAKAAESQWKKVKNGARIEDKQATNALVSNAKGVIAEVESYLKETHISSPFKGEVSNIISEQGELVPAGYPVITLVDMSDAWIVFNIREDLLSKFTLGKKIEAIVPALQNKKVTLKISYITVLGSYANWNATKANGDFDMKTFEIHAVPINPIPHLRTGMSVLLDAQNL